METEGDMKSLALLPIASLVLLAIACGGGDKESGEGTAAPTTVAASPASGGVSAEYRSAAPAAAEAALLIVDDLPSGWTGEPAAESTSDVSLTGMCAAFNTRDGFPGSIADASSDDLTGPGGQEASSGAAVFASAQVAQSTLDQLNSLVNTCRVQLIDVFSELFKQGYVEGGGELSDLTEVETSVSDLSYPALGDDSNAYRVTINATVGATKISSVIDVIIIRSGAMGASLTYFVIGEVDDEEEQSLVETVASKLEQADASLPR